MPGTHLPLNTNRRMAAWTPLPTPAAKAMATAEAVLAAVYGGGTDSRRPKDTFWERPTRSICSIPLFLIWNFHGCFGFPFSLHAKFQVSTSSSTFSGSQCPIDSSFRDWVQLPLGIGNYRVGSKLCGILVLLCYVLELKRVLGWFVYFCLLTCLWLRVMQSIVQLNRSLWVATVVNSKTYIRVSGQW